MRLDVASVGLTQNITGCLEICNICSAQSNQQWTNNQALRPARGSGNQGESRRDRVIPRKCRTMSLQKREACQICEKGRILKPWLIVSKVALTSKNTTRITWTLSLAPYIGREAIYHLPQISGVSNLTLKRTVFHVRPGAGVKGLLPRFCTYFIKS